MKRTRTLFHRLSLLALVLTMAPCAAPAQSAPATPPYKISPGDTFDVSFRWTPEFNQSVTVQPDGHAMLTSAGDIAAAGMTVQQLHEAIATRSTEKLVDPEFTVTLKEFDKPHFVVAGEVATPGRFEMRGATTALQAVLLAGGGKEGSSMGHVILFRHLNSDLSEVHRLNFNKYDAKHRPVEDILLQPGDMLLVSRDKLSQIGRVIRTFNLGVYFNPLSSNGL
jgi:polysaccharide export outer membrane protein